MSKAIAITLVLTAALLASPAQAAQTVAAKKVVKPVVVVAKPAVKKTVKALVPAKKPVAAKPLVTGKYRSIASKYITSIHPTALKNPKKVAERESLEEQEEAREHALAAEALKKMQSPTTDATTTPDTAVADTLSDATGGAE